MERDAPLVPLLRATVEGDVDTVFLLCSSDQRGLTVIPTKPSLSIGIHTFVAPEIDWIHENLESSDDLTDLLDDLASGKAVAACDGSYFETRDIGAAAWIVSSSNGTSWIQGGGRIPGPATELNSYRCELGGLLGIADITKSLSSALPREPFLLTNACDNLEAVKKIVVPKTKVQQTWKSVDLITQILDIWQLQQGKPVPTHQKFISKWVSEDTATGLVMVRRKQRDSSACPRCDAENEHLVHILSCPQQSAKETTQSLLTELEHWLIQEDTHPQLTAALMHTLTHWFHDPYDDDPIQYQTDERLRQALSNQDSIGWYAFLMGCISTYIIQYQTLLLKPILFQKNGFVSFTPDVRLCAHILLINSQQILPSAVGLDSLQRPQLNRFLYYTQISIHLSRRRPSALLA